MKNNLVWEKYVHKYAGRIIYLSLFTNMKQSKKMKYNYINYPATFHN